MNSWITLSIPNIKVIQLFIRIIHSVDEIPFLIFPHRFVNTMNYGEIGIEIIVHCINKEIFSSSSYRSFNLLDGIFIRHRETPSCCWSQKFILRRYCHDLYLYQCPTWVKFFRDPTRSEHASLRSSPIRSDPESRVVFD